MQQSYLQQLADYRDYVAGLDITDEERQERMLAKQQELQEAYGDFLNQALADGAWITDEYGVQNHNLIDSFGETTLGIEGQFNSLNDMLDAFRESSLKTDEEITKSFQQWYEDRERILQEAGQDMDDFADIVVEDMGDVSEAMDTAADAAEQMSEDMKTEFQEILDNLKKMFYGEDGMSKTIDEIIAKFKTWQQTILDLIKSIGDLNNTPIKNNVPSTGGGGGSGGGGGGGSGGGDSGGGGGGGGGCSGNCTGSCTGGCKTGCSGGCKDGCKGCNNTCSGTCKGTSSQTGCAASCTGTCKTGCLATSKASAGGCFDSGTKILMADGTEKNIEDIVIGDIIIAYNEKENIFEFQKVINTMIHHNTIEMIDLYLDDGTHIGMTACHPILTTDGWKSLNHDIALLEHWIETTPIEIGQKVICKDGILKEIIKIEYRKNIENYNTYNISVGSVHTYIANGIIVHNAMTKMASGGYTGAWGPEGKAAILHEKELILNKADTANMLATVAFVRDLVQMVGLNASSAANGLGSLFAGGVSSGGNYLDQNVTIHAEFPNATNHTEIEEAFNNLIGLAGQYAGRKQ